MAGRDAGVAVTCAAQALIVKTTINKNKVEIFGTVISWHNKFVERSNGRTPYAVLENTPRRGYEPVPPPPNAPVMITLLP